VTESSNSVFLSYASEDVNAAKRIADAFRAAGIDVWFDQSELRGGDLWQQNIQQQIRECRLFIPIISSATEARGEGFFRLEWKLAVDRSHLMASDRRFIVPVVIDETSAAHARIPDRFHEYQWMKLPVGEVTPQFIERVSNLLTEVRSPPADPRDSTRHDEPLPRRNFAKSSRHYWIWVVPALLLAALSIVLIYERGNARITPYSASDRRMTFAALPALFSDQKAGDIEAAAANTDAYTTALERNDWWAHTADRDATRNVATKFHSVHEIAQALNVHFLLRGTLRTTQTGHAIDLKMLDGESEREVGADTLTFDDPQLTATPLGKYDEAIAGLITSALRVEVKRAEGKPENELDVRDLTFRGYAYWFQHDGDADGYRIAEGYLERALKLAPNDFLALEATAEINLCDCLHAWAKDIKKETAIGAAALDKIARLYPQQPSAGLRLKVLMLQGRYEEALALSDVTLRPGAEDMDHLHYRIVALIHLGRAKEAQPSIKVLEAHANHSRPEIYALMAAADYATEDYGAAVKHAQAATASMTEEDSKNAATGAVRLTLAAAQARMGNMEKARTSLEEFRAAVPEATTIGAIRQWLYPTADLYGFQPLFDGLRLAGLSD
jgi:tetratricopeptide (TPR) repeat protein